MYMCGCGYEPISANASRHKTSYCKHDISIEHREYVLKKGTIINENVKCINKEINRLNKECEAKDAKISRISRKLAEDIDEFVDDDDNNEIKEGLVYYIVDRNIQIRGKIIQLK